MNHWYKGYEWGNLIVQAGLSFFFCFCCDARSMQATFGDPTNENVCCGLENLNCVQAQISWKNSRLNFALNSNFPAYRWFCKRLKYVSGQTGRTKRDPLVMGFWCILTNVFVIIKLKGERRESPRIYFSNLQLDYWITGLFWRCKIRPYAQKVCSW